MRYTINGKELKLYNIDEDSYILLFKTESDKKLFKLNKTGYLILKVLIDRNGELSQEELINLLKQEAQEHVSDEIIMRDIESFLKNLEKLGIIT